MVSRRENLQLLTLRGIMLLLPADEIEAVDDVMSLMGSKTVGTLFSGMCRN